MSRLRNTRRVLKEYLLQSNCSRSDIQRLFVLAGFGALERPRWRKSDVVEQFYAQRDWSSQAAFDSLFHILFEVLSDLKRKCAADVAGGRRSRELFSKILLDGLRRDGAELFPDRVGWALTGSRDAATRVPQSTLTAAVSSGAANSLDLLLLGALTEEYQVIASVLRQVARPMGEEGNALRYQYSRKDGTVLNLAVASPFRIGAVSLGVFVAPLLRELRPNRAALIGIAAAVDVSEVELGDVPCASQVLSLDDISVENSELCFRSEGSLTDAEVLRRIGRLRTLATEYEAWQRECETLIANVVEDVNRLRRHQIIVPDVFGPPHIVVGCVAGGPFLIRDAKFRESLRKSGQRPKHGGIRLVSPAHPKLLSAEMEAHGFMRAAHEAGIPASVLKGISDVGDTAKRRLEKKTGGFYRAYACSNALLTLLHSLR